MQCCSDPGSHRLGRYWISAKEVIAAKERPTLPRPTPLLEGLPGDLCQCPHWGTVLKGSITVRYADGHEETVEAGEVYYWPPGHTIRVDEDYEAVEISPSGPMGELIEHLKSKLSG